MAGIGKDPRFTGDVQKLIGAKAEYAGVTYEEAADEVLLDMQANLVSITVALDRFMEKRRKKHEAGVREIPVRYQVTTFKVPRLVMETAMRLADGDISRLSIQEDGSVVILNESRRPE